MRKQLFLSLLALATAGGVMAQTTTTTTTTLQAAPTPPRGMQQKNPSERTKETILRLQADLSINNEQSAKAQPVFLEFYTNMQQAMDDMRASGSFDCDAMKATKDKLAAIRDKHLTEIFTADQMTKWKTVVEPSMRPQKKPEGEAKPQQ